MQKILDPMSGDSIYQQQSSVKSAKRELKMARRILPLLSQKQVDQAIKNFIVEPNPKSTKVRLRLNGGTAISFEHESSGCYLVTREAGSTPVVDTAFFDKATNKWKTQNSTVTAFRELPEPYQPEETK